MNWQKLWSEQSLLSSALVPASWAYALALAAKPAPEPIKVEGLQVISVGNLLAGGAGKTPVVLFLAAWALELGHQAAVLSRGYGRLSSLAIHHAPNQPLPSVDEIGDEPRLLARRLPKLHLFVSANRVQSAQRARQAGCTIAILDDGFQHRRLYRDHDLLIDAGIGNGHLLPAGPLREPIAAAQRATIVWSRDGATALTSFNALRIEATHGVSSVLSWNRPAIVFSSCNPSRK